MTGTPAVLDNRYTINGVIQTSGKVMDNINKIAAACGAYVTYDIHEGKWSIIINAPGDAIWSFYGNNIIGAVNVSSTGLDQLYNAVKVTYVHEDLRGKEDFIEVIIPDTEWYPNESLNVLNLNYGLVNNQVQAQILGTIEMKQSRIDRIVSFQTDYSMINCRAGDIIDITLPMYNWDHKKFRIITITEDDPDTGEIMLNITALEYDAGVYDTTNLVRYERAPTNSIANNKSTVMATANTNIATSAAAQTSALNAATLATAAALDALAGAVPGAKVKLNTKYAIITWKSFDGVDLDIRCSIITPNIGMSDPASDLTNTFGYTTYNGASAAYWYKWPKTGGWVLAWGGDNTGGLSRENVAISIPGFRALYPTATEIVAECRGNWYSTAGKLPVQLYGTLHQGGTISSGTLSGGNGSSTGYGFNVTGDTKELNVVGQTIPVTSYNGVTTDGKGVVNGVVLTNSLGDWTAGNAAGASTFGDLMGYFHYDLVNNQAWFSLSKTE